VAGIGFGGSAARADSTCAVGGSGNLAVGTTGGGAQVCTKSSVLTGTVTVTPSYVAADGYVSNSEPLDGYVAADSDGAYVCASGDYTPGGSNPSIVTPGKPVPDPNGSCTPRTGR
jgi:hypothetical protein